MRNLVTGRKALLAGLLGAVAAILAAVALLQLQGVEERVSGPLVEKLATTVGQETTEDRSTEDNERSAPSERTTAPSGEARKNLSGAGKPEFADLESEVRRISASHRGKYGVVVWQPGSEGKVALRSEERFESASLAKLPVLLALYREAEQGSLSLGEQIEMKPSDVQSGTGELKNRPPGTAITLRECAKHLMKYSDNTAWAMLEDRLGMDRIRSEIASAGARSTNYEYAKHSTTPNDTLKMLRKISDPGYTSPRYSRQMLGDMTNTSFEAWLPQGLPPEVRISHKIGILGDSFADAGIVYPPEGEDSSKPYYVVVLAKDTTEPQARAAMQEIALASHRHLVNPESDPRSERRGLQALSDHGQ